MSRRVQVTAVWEMDPVANDVVPSDLANEIMGEIQKWQQPPNDDLDLINMRVDVQFMPHGRVVEGDTVMGGHSSLPAVFGGPHDESYYFPPDHRLRFIEDAHRRGGMAEVYRVLDEDL